MLVWQRLRDALDRHGKVAMATIVETFGSSPREAGARVVVMPDGTFFGTIGGGTLEWRVIAELQGALGRPRGASCERRSVALGPELGQCCGGRVDLALEVFDASSREAVAMLAEAERNGPFRTTASEGRGGPLVRRIDAGGDVAIGGAARHGAVIEEGFGDDRRPLYLFGAGHVGRAVVLALAPLPFAVDWIDPRPDAFPAHVPGNVRCIRADDVPATLAAAVDGSFVLVMTHSHALDLAVVLAALSAGRFPYVGLIGSATKRARFTRQLRDAGLSAEQIAALVSPIGVPGIRSKLPAAIAASVASDLLIRDEALRAAASAEPVATRLASIHSPRGR
jgi:xanthine dehydrogenase accessory factor